MMNFVQEDNSNKGYCNNNEEEADDEEVMIRPTGTTNLPFPSSSSSKQHHHHQYHQNLHWLPNLDSQQSQDPTTPTAINFDNKVDLMMDLSLGNNNTNNNEEEEEEESNIVGVGVGDGSSSGGRAIEKEHMFDKVVTPSDVGKLNRLVIPKQHAEKYFPLDSSSNDKGLLLNFEDRNGKSWRFRYSYWNSSQSYVMTKGWSRFVKEKKLDAGDIVSFQRGVGDSAKDRLYIDWRRRPNAPDPTSLARIQLQNQFNSTFPHSLRWGRLYSLPQPPMCLSSRNYEPLHRLNYSIYPYNHHHHHQHQHQHQQQLQLQHQQQAMSYGNAAAAYQYYNRASSISGSHHHRYPIGGAMQGLGEPMVIDSVPVMNHDVEMNNDNNTNNNKTGGKRLRLFGVNMEYCSTQDHDIGNPTASSDHHHLHHDSSSSSSLQSRFSNNSSTTTTPLLSGMQQQQQAAAAAEEYSKKGKSSLSIDLDL